MNDIESIRIDFIIAHALFFSLAYCVTDEARLSEDIDKFFVLIPRLGAFVASVLGITVQEAADKTIAMIEDESTARAFFDEHFECNAS